MIALDSVSEKSISGFFNDYSQEGDKGVLFWDTCALLEILRFSYRGHDLAQYDSLLKIKRQIVEGKLVSVSSKISIKEWNDHCDHVEKEFKENLKKTYDLHNLNTEIINRQKSSSYSSFDISRENLITYMKTLAQDILEKTIFLETEEIANAALWRVAYKRPPASKKNEFKDCAIWETVLGVSKKISTSAMPRKICFFTVNTDDFLKKSRTPHQLYFELATEAASTGLKVAFDFKTSADHLGL